MTKMADASRDRLVHDLKNQLGIIIGFADWVLSQTPSGDPRHEDVVEIERAARRAVQLVQQLSSGPGPEGTW